jgi:hypothetical protein
MCLIAEQGFRGEGSSGLHETTLKHDEIQTCIFLNSSFFGFSRFLLFFFFPVTEKLE